MNDSQKSNTTNSIDLNKELLESDYNLEIIDNPKLKIIS